MKLVVEKALLLKALSHAQGIVERRAVSPILSNVLLKAEDDKLVITATDLDVSIVESLPATVEKGGATTVSAHTFYDVVRKLPEGSEIEVSEKVENSQLVIKCGKSKFNLPVLSAKDFTNLKTSDLPHHFKLKAAELRNLINHTRFAISTEETRYYLNGIYLHTCTHEGDLVLRAVSTDGHRLALADVLEPEGAAGMPDVIVPRKAILELSKLLEGVDLEVGVALSLTQITFSVGRILLASRLIDGTFPDYEKVIPSSNPHMLTVNCKKFAEAVDRVSTIASEKSKGVKITMEPQKIIISASSTDQGMGTEELDATYNGKRLIMGFNARYLLDVAQQVSGENMVFWLSDENSPTIIKGGAEENTLYVLMPMRL
jgi:DNA polymerase-3 subunit beta